ncbi:type 1 fimbrial protein [Providencia rettgeri]|nr:type 1 fimbrial protein [Providencia rettgeri]ELL9156084.1 type 1 fimbrial protein [Providencia rettgeri]ELR5152592.1 type 1 fimbrial protein [Providencia rettgeri]
MMNKKLISAIAAVSFASLFSATALSAPVANLKVSGKITPPTCMVNGSNETDLLYSFGSVSPTVIPQDSTYNGLPSLSNNLTITCDAETFLTFKATDNYPNAFDATVSGANTNFKSIIFNLVNSADTTKNVGGIAYTAQDVTVDGNAAYISRANDAPSDNGTWAQNQHFVIGATMGWTSEPQKYVAPSALKLQSGKVFSMGIKNISNLYLGISNTFLHSKAALAKDGIDITNGLDYVGQTVLTFNFGI